MLRYEVISNTTISIDLHNDFAVIAIMAWNNQDKKYEVKLYLKRNDVDLLDLIDAPAQIEFESDIKTIKLDITKHVDRLLSRNFFTPFIERFNYMMKCFDIGDDILEKERLGKDDKHGM